MASVLASKVGVRNIVSKFSTIQMLSLAVFHCGATGYRIIVAIASMCWRRTWLTQSRRLCLQVGERVAYLSF